MASLLDIMTIAEAITTRWHTVRSINKASALVKKTILRYHSPKRQRYDKGKIKVYLDSQNRLKVMTTDKISNIIEYGFRGYHWGRKVLNNPMNKVFGSAPNRYMRIMIKDRLLGQVTGKRGKMLTVSERAINKNPSKWRMPARAGERYMRNALNQKRREIRKMITDSVTKDILNALKKVG